MHGGHRVVASAVVALVVVASAVIALPALAGPVPVAFPVVASTSAAAAKTYAWEPARVDGGGFVTVLAPSPGDDRIVARRLRRGGRVPQHRRRPHLVGLHQGLRGERPAQGRCHRVGSVQRQAGVGVRRCGQTDRDDGRGAAHHRRRGDVGHDQHRRLLLRRRVRRLGRDRCPSPLDRAAAGRRPDAAEPALDRHADGRCQALDGRWRDLGCREGWPGCPSGAWPSTPPDPNTLYAAVRSPPGAACTARRMPTPSAPTWQLLPGPAYGRGAGDREPAAVRGGRQPGGVVGRPRHVGPGAGAGRRRPACRSGPLTDVMTITADGRARASRRCSSAWIADAVCLDVAATWCPTVWRSKDRRGHLDAAPGHGRRRSSTDRWADGRCLASGRAIPRPCSVAPPTSPPTSRSTRSRGPASWWRVVPASGAAPTAGPAGTPCPAGSTMTFHGQPSTDAVVPGSVVVPTSDWNLLGTNDNGRTVSEVPVRGRDGGPRLALSGWTGPGSAPLYVGVGFGAPDSELYVQQVPGGPFEALGFGVASQCPGRAGGRGSRRRRPASRRGDRAGRGGLAQGSGTVRGRWPQPCPAGIDGTVIARTGTLAWAPDGALYASDRGDASLDGGVALAGCRSHVAADDATR